MCVCARARVCVCVSHLWSRRDIWRYHPCLRSCALSGGKAAWQVNQTSGYTACTHDWCPLLRIGDRHASECCIRQQEQHGSTWWQFHGRGNIFRCRYGDRICFLTMTWKRRTSMWQWFEYMLQKHGKSDSMTEFGNKCWLGCKRLKDLSSTCSILNKFNICPTFFSLWPATAAEQKQWYTKLICISNASVNALLNALKLH